MYSPLQLRFASHLFVTASRTASDGSDYRPGLPQPLPSLLSLPSLEQRRRRLADYSEPV